MSKEKSFDAGVIAGVELFGRVCGKQANCEVCPIGSIRATGVTCQDFARQFPIKMTSLLKEMDSGQLTYYDEYCLRFPNCNIDIENLSMFMCRKATFEGYLGCEKEGQECIDCWKQPYVTDITETDDDEEDEMDTAEVQVNQNNIKYCMMCGQKLAVDASFCEKCGSPQK